MLFTKIYSYKSYNTSITLRNVKPHIRTPVCIMMSLVLRFTFKTQCLQIDKRLNIEVRRLALSEISTTGKFFYDLNNISVMF